MNPPANPPEVTLTAHLRWLASLWPLVAPVGVALVVLWADVRAHGDRIRALEAEVAASARVDDLRRLERQLEADRAVIAEMRHTLETVSTTLTRVCVRVRCREE